ncbi:nucleoside transporter-domain-containing protein [Dipodascopsis uninucleata]
MASRNLLLEDDIGKVSSSSLIGHHEESDGTVELFDEVEADVAPSVAGIKGSGGNIELNHIDYITFLLIGIAMLWPWNCFLSAAAYFQMRFRESDFLRENFQSCMMSTSTITATCTMAVLSYMQRTASYPFRIWIALAMNIVNFTILAIASVVGRSFALWPYFVYLMVSVFFSALSTSLSQNGGFAISNIMAPIYTQAIMVGQAVAGVLPSIAQILSVVLVANTKLADGSDDLSSSATSSFIYFLTATGVTTIALFSFLKFYRQKSSLIERFSKQNRAEDEEYLTAETTERTARRYIPAITLWKKLKGPAFAVFYAFGVTMMFPVFASNTLSVNYEVGVSGPNSWYRPSVFIPFVFLIWNLGDLAGRVICGRPNIVTRNGKTLVIWSLLRTLFIPFFLLCNVHGRGASINSDFIYVILQFLFGISNGYITSCGMMIAESFVEEEEKEAAGGFMGVAFNMGLALGSVCSFILVAAIE